VNRPLVFLVLAALAIPAAAQAPPPEPIKLTLSPAAEPVPALKYPLLPELSEKTPGNAALLYYRAFSPEWWTNVRQRPIMEKVEKASEAPLTELKNSDLRWLLELKALREVDRAARREHCDWELTPRLKEDGINLLIPDVQAMREFALFLTVRARLEMAAGQLDKALYTLQTGFALARHVGDGPTFIQALVGTAVANRMIVQLEELLRQPGAPNLYWGLTDLPRPFIDLHRPIQGEKLWLFGTWPELREANNPYLSPRQRERLQVIADQLVSENFEPNRKSDVEVRLATITLVAKAYPEAKRALVAAGRKPEEIEALPTVQVVLLAALRDFEHHRDDAFKWMALPYPEARPGLERAQQALKETRVRYAGIPIAATFLPATIKVYSASTRIDRRIAALRCVEAIRLYAAAHEGKLPATLADVKEVPIPTDPMTGKGFDYKVNGDTATISAGPPPGEPASGPNTLIYELTLRK
jgi:hypothetical protein